MKATVASDDAIDISTRAHQIDAPEGYSRECYDEFAIVVQEVADALAPDVGAVVSGQYEPPAYWIRVAAAQSSPSEPTPVCDCDSDLSYVSREGNVECCSLCDWPKASVESVEEERNNDNPDLREAAADVMRHAEYDDLLGRWRFEGKALADPDGVADDALTALDAALAAQSSPSEPTPEKAQVTVGLSRIGPHGGVVRRAGPVNDREVEAINAAYSVMLDDTELCDDFEAARKMTMAVLASVESVEEERNNDNPETVERVARAMAEAPDSETEWDKLARRALAAARVDPSEIEAWKYERDLAHRNTAKAEEALSRAEAEVERLRQAQEHEIAQRGKVEVRLMQAGEPLDMLLEGAEDALDDAGRLDPQAVKALVLRARAALAVNPSPPRVGVGRRKPLWSSPTDTTHHHPRRSNERGDRRTV